MEIGVGVFPENGDEECLDCEALGQAGCKFGKMMIIRHQFPGSRRRNNPHIGQKNTISNGGHNPICQQAGPKMILLHHVDNRKQYNSIQQGDKLRVRHSKPGPLLADEIKVQD